VTDIARLRHDFEQISYQIGRNHAQNPNFFSENDLETQKNRSKPQIFSENDLKTTKNRLKTQKFSENVKSWTPP
jgi:hypothetical protein